ncbi:MAG: hypothetical protein K2Q03_04025, partial [Sphingobacteriaceae bacterium]|nr:hypothetical protein [Sphingobacteriaceae bacterium]
MLDSFKTGELVMDEETEQLHVVLGNSVTEENELWCADWITLKTKYTDIGNLNLQTKVKHPDWLELIKRMEDTAEKGDSDAMWWCAWVHEGKNHPKSVWYYMAAMR